MKKSSEASSAVKVARQLTELTSGEINLIIKKLDIQGFDANEYDPWDLPNALFHFVGNCNLEQIQLLEDYFFQNARDIGSQDSKPTDHQIFISFHSSDKEIAGQIAAGIQRSGLEVFLAHRDIQPGTKWRSELSNRLDSATHMICIIGANYSQSPICCQEIGWALARKLPLVPLSLSEDVQPQKMGLIEQFQFHFFENNLALSASVLIKSLVSSTPNPASLVDRLVEAFASTKSFETAKARWLVLEQIESVSFENRSRIANALLANPQISEANFGRLKLSIENWLKNFGD